MYLDCDQRQNTRTRFNSGSWNGQPAESMWVVLFFQINIFVVGTLPKVNDSIVVSMNRGLAAPSAHDRTWLTTVRAELDPVARSSLDMFTPLVKVVRTHYVPLVLVLHNLVSKGCFLHWLWVQRQACLWHQHVKWDITIVRTRAGFVPVYNGMVMDKGEFN